jgi:L-amino acid N-acyltransferase YncA
MDFALDRRAPLQRLREISRWQGVPALGFRLLAHVGCRRVGWWVRTLDEPLPAPRPVRGSIVELTTADAVRYLALGTSATPEQVRDRFAAGHRLWAVVGGGGELVAAAWWARGRGWLEYLAVPLELAPEEVYVYHCFTAPARRGEGLQPALLGALLHAAHAAGARRASAAIEPENRPSVRAFERLGFRRVGTLVRLGPRRAGWIVRRGEVPA